MFFLHRGAIDFDEMAAGVNKRRMIQTTVFQELVKVTNSKLATFLFYMTHFYMSWYLICVACGSWSESLSTC